jgi:hydrogenase maturation factor
MSKSVKFTLLCTILALVAGQVQAFPGASAQPAGAPAAANQAVAIKGTVVETMNASGYTYVCVESGGQKQWAAVPATEVKVGDSVEVAPGMVMHNFNSKALKRTFDSIVFSGGLAKPKP